MSELPDMPQGLVGNERSHWETMVDRYQRIDNDIRGQEAIGKKPGWLDPRRSERSSIAWALTVIAAAVRAGAEAHTAK